MLFHHLRTRIANDYALAIGSSRLELLCGLSTVLALYSRKHLRLADRIVINVRNLFRTKMMNNMKKYII